MDSAAIVVGLTCVANLSLGLFILLRNFYDRTGQSFFLGVVFASIWSISNYLTDNAPRLNLNIFFNRLSYLSAFLGVVMAAVFTTLFSYHKLPTKRKYLIGGSVLLVVIGGLSVSRYVAGTVSKEAGKLAFKQGPLVTLYGLILISLIAVIIWNLYRLIRKGSLLQRNQARIIILGLSTSILLGVITNVVIPAYSSSFSAAKYGPPFLSLLLVSSTTYAVVKHRLFDIRPIVARSLAYLLTLISIALGYVAVVFGIAHKLFSTSQLQTKQQVIFVLFTLFAALSFQPIKRFFDKITNRIFYRDAYDAQELLNSLNRSLVTVIELEDLLGRSASVIGDAIKAEYCTFAIKNEQEHSLRLVGGSKRYSGNQTAEKIQDIAAATVHLADKIIIADELEANRAHIQELMRAADVSAFVKLQGRTKGRGQHPGYILLGPKRSGGLYSSQDVRILGIIADELVIAIQNSLRFEEIQRFNVTLRQKIEEATRQLRKANTRLREMDKAKDEFISMASHQLRTPLTTVEGYLSMVLEGDVGPITKAEREYIRKAFEGAKRMVYLIADMLNVSRMQTGKFVIENKPTNLAKLVDEEVSQLLSAAGEHKLKLVYHKPESFPELNLDENKIRQVVMNFIDNAIYYTPAGGSITADLSTNDKEVVFTVTDTGIGVPPRLQHQLFSKFYRADNARKVRPDGTGLGLFMAKKVIAAQGGAIIFKSTEGKGSTFGFSFPLKMLASATVKTRY